MSLEVATYIADLVSANPVGSADPKSQGDDHIRLIKQVLQNTIPGLAGRINRITDRGSAYTAVLNDNLTVIRSSGTWTLTLTAASTLGNGWSLVLFNDGAGNITISPAAGTINGGASLVVGAGQFTVIYSNGSNFFAARAYISPGSMSAQNASAVAITGGTIAGITDLAVADGGTGASDAAGARANLGAQAAHAKLTALSGLAGGADRLPYFTNTDSMAQTTFSSFMRTLLDDPDAATARTTLGAQVSHAKLTSLSGLAGGADRLPYFTGTDTFTQTVLTAFARSLLDDGDAATARETLGLGSAATQADTKYAHRANNLSDLSSITTARSNLGLGALAILNTLPPTSLESYTVGATTYQIATLDPVISPGVVGPVNYNTPIRLPHGGTIRLRFRLLFVDSNPTATWYLQVNEVTIESAVFGNSTVTLTRDLNINAGDRIRLGVSIQHSNAGAKTAIDSITIGVANPINPAFQQV